MIDPQAPSSVARRVASMALAIGAALAQEPPAKTFAELKTEGALQSSYRAAAGLRTDGDAMAPDLAGFRADVEPILARTCYRCHGPDRQRGDVRIDALDPDLFEGGDVEPWLDVLAVLNNGEMPPPDEDDVEFADDDRRKVVDWLVAESQNASTMRRGTATTTSVRRLARYEYAHVLQDLLALSHDFADDLPPDPVSREGFENSSEVLHLTGVQFRAYLESAQKALELATVHGEQPKPLHWSAPMAAAAAAEWQKQDRQLDEARTQHAEDPAKLEATLAELAQRHRQRPHGVYFLDPATGRMAGQSWGYDGAKYAWTPGDESRAAPEFDAAATTVAVVPPRQALIVELGDRVPERGSLRVRVRAARAQADGDHLPSLRLAFGWQASNDSRAEVTIGEHDLVVDAAPGSPHVYEWNVELTGIYPRNSVRNVTRLGDLPSPSELLKIYNASRSGGDVLVDLVEVTAPVYAQWPPASHRRVFPAAYDGLEEPARARAVLADFLPRAFRRAVGDDEVERKLRLFERLRPACANFEQAMVEVLAAVLASPEFLFVGAAPGDDAAAGAPLSGPELATRLSLFLWCSAPDDELRRIADEGRLSEPAVLRAQVARMLDDPKAQRFARHFVRQWLNLQLLDFLHVDAKHHPGFDDELRAAMREEPIAFFAELLREDLSALELLHADFTMANERLAAHYGLRGVTGDDFRRVALDAASGRGGILTQAGLLAMNSDGVDSHPLKRGVWLLERLLDDPPPPPPAAVPQIDLADPEIAKMTLKQRLEDHRNAPACMSCHSKIDPWGIAFEHFDAVGRWRDAVDGRPVDATAELFNKQRLDGADGLKRFLLQNRQDQFVRALVVKLTTYALGRPLTFADRAAVDAITADVRRQGDGLATMVTRIATSELFSSR